MQPLGELRQRAAAVGDGVLLDGAQLGERPPVELEDRIVAEPTLAAGFDDRPGDDALDGFPGPYSSYVEDTLGIERVWNLVADEDDRSAAFRGVIAYCDGDPFEATPEPVDTDRRGQDLAAEGRPSATTDDQVAEGPLPVKLFEGVVPGRIVAPRGEGGFGFDPVFEHDGRTFAELSTVEKNTISHRGRALAKFAEWLHLRV